MDQQTDPKVTQERTWAMICHLAGFAGPVFPLGNIFGPLIIWLIKRPESEFIDDQGKESLNFQISITIYAIVSGMLIFLLVGMLLLPVVLIFDIVSIITASVSAHRGDRYRYAFSLRLIK